MASAVFRGSHQASNKLHWTDLLPKRRIGIPCCLRGGFDGIHLNSGGFLEATNFGDDCWSQLGSASRPFLNDRFHGAGEVIVQVEAVALAVLDEGVGHAGQFSATSGSKRQVVLRTNF